MAVAVVTGSIGVLSEGIHSSLDLLSSLVTFFVVRASVRPADWDHPFGHGKIESLSALFESFLLMVAGVYVLYDAVSTMAVGGHHLYHVAWGLGVTAVAMAVNLFVYLQNRGVAQQEESIAIETNAFHFLTDVFSSMAVFIGLGLVHFTRLSWGDSAAALLVAVYIFVVGVQQMRKCLAELSDSVLPDEEVEAVRSVLEKHENSFINYHDLRTRKAGAVRHIDLHLTMCSNHKVSDAHDVCDRIEEDIKRKFHQAQVNIHVEPCGNHGESCETFCTLKKDRHS